MNIKIDDTFSLKSDPLNVMLVETKTRQDGKNIGKKVDTVVGYYGTVESALLGYLTYKTNTSQATTIKQLRDDIKEVKEIILKIMEQE